VIFAQLGNYDRAWQAAVLIGLIAGIFQMLMNVRPPVRRDAMPGALPSAA